MIPELKGKDSKTAPVCDWSNLVLHPDAGEGLNSRGTMTKGTSSLTSE